MGSQRPARQDRNKAINSAPPHTRGGGSPKYPKMKKRFVKNTIWPRAKSAVIALFSAALFFALPACKNGSASQELFDKAIEHYNAFEMNEAKLLFTKSGLKDAGAYLESIKQFETYYIRAVNAYESGDYSTAEAVFTSIKDYLNSAEYLKAISDVKDEYARAVELYEEGRYLEALSEFMPIEKYAHSAEYIENIEKMRSLYADAFEYVALGDYRNAVAALKAINAPFENSAEIIEELEKRTASQPIRLGSFIKRYEAEFRDGTKIEGGETGELFYMVDSHGAWISGAMDENGSIRYISVYLNKRARNSLKKEGERLTISSFIHALDPDFADKETVFSDLPTYLRESGWRYSSMQISGGEDEYGGIVARAEYRP